MSNVSPQLAVYSLHTPSPFSLSVASTGLSSRPSIDFSILFLRALALLLSFISSLSLAAPSTSKIKNKEHLSFYEYPELLYCFIATILAFTYSACQLFKGISDIVYGGVLISDMVSDHMTFILDQLAGYLLVSSSSVSVAAIQHTKLSTTLRKATIVSICMSFSAFLVIAASALLSGYKLCKRIIW